MDRKEYEEKTKQVRTLSDIGDLLACDPDIPHCFSEEEVQKNIMEEPSNLKDFDGKPIIWKFNIRDRVALIRDSNNYRQQCFSPDLTNKKGCKGMIVGKSSLMYPYSCYLILYDNGKKFYTNESVLGKLDDNDNTIQEPEKTRVKTWFSRLFGYLGFCKAR